VCVCVCVCGCVCMRYACVWLCVSGSPYPSGSFVNSEQSPITTWVLEPWNLDTTKETDVYIGGGGMGKREDYCPQYPSDSHQPQRTGFINMHEFICIAAGRGKLTFL